MTAIARIEPIAIALSLTHPMKMSGVEIHTADSMVVRLETRSGVVGWGEAAAAPNMTGETLESMLAAVRYMAPYLTGRSIDDAAAIHDEMDWRMVANHAAKAAIDVALCDALGKVRQVPVSELLAPGRSKRSRLPVLWLIGTGSTDGDVREALAKKADGFVSYKIKVGADSVAEDAERTARICDALGRGLLISADANQAWSTEAALAYVRAVAPTALDFLEQPCRAHNIEGMARVAAATRIAIGTDEGIHSLADIRTHHAARAASGASVKTIKLGGLRPAFAAGVLCDALGMKVNLACKIAESSIGTAAILQLAAALPQIDWSVSPSCQYLETDVVRAPIRVMGGHVSVPGGHGLGIEVDEAKLAAVRRRM
jgi:L-alanine-DL-glutamate epimerase-like enolase superfamily enzyme